MDGFFENNQVLCPVNESVWEHFKLGYWSVVLFSMVEYFPIRHRVHNYWLAKIIGVIALELVIILIFYGYTFILGKDVVLLDIASYVIGAIVCQYLVYLILRFKSLSESWNRISLAAFIALGIVFGVTTYYPPHSAIFMDNNSHTFGINKEK